MIEKGTNNLHVRNINKKRVIQLLYENGGLTKQNIASMLELSMPTISQIMAELHENGLVKKAGTLESSGGRKPVLNTIVYDAKYAIGMNITQNRIGLAMIDLAGKVQCSRSVNENFENTGAYFKKLGDICEKAIADSKIDREKLLGVGISLPGIVSTGKGVLEYAPTLGVRGLCATELTQYIPYPCFLGNEANLAGFAELWGLGNLDSAVYLSVNKGVGGAIILNNKLFYGQNDRAGEFGHMKITENGKTCSCGQKGCFEAYCSTRVLLGEDYPDLSAFFSALKNGSPSCAKTWDTYLSHLAAGISNLRMIFDTEMIIGGELTAFLADDLDLLRGKLKDLDLFHSNCDYIHLSKYEKLASSVGAGLLLVERFLDS